MDELPRRYAGLDVPHWEQYTGCWAIHPPRFHQFAAFCAGLNPQNHVLAAQAAMATSRRQQEEDAVGYAIHDGVALMEIVGPMTKYGSSFAPMGAMLEARRTLRAAVADPRVRAVVMRIDSPGGTVAGTDDLANEVAAAAEKKPIVAFAEDLMASAAYYVASQADEIVATRSTDIGSIGVLMVIDDFSGMYAMKGIKTHVLSTGAQKGAGVEGTPITNEQLDEWQRMVDEHMEFFVSAISRGRGMDREQVLVLGDGRMWLAAEAKKLGLIDRVGSLEQAMKRARELAGQRDNSTSTTARGTTARQDDEKRATADDGSAALMETETKEIEMGTQGTPAVVPSPPTVIATALEGRLESKAATLAELKASFADAPAEFHLNCLEQELTLAQATSAWMGRLRDRVKVQETALKETAAATAGIKPPGNAPVPSGGTTTAGTTANATAEWQDAVAEEMSKGKGVTRDAAVRAVNKRRPGLRQDMLREHNTTHGRSKAAAGIE